MLPFHCLPLLPTLVLLAYASNYAVQALGTVSQSLQIPPQTASNVSSTAILLNGTVHELSREQQPSSFNVDYLYKSNGRMFDRIDFYSAILDNVASLSKVSWSRGLDVIQLGPSNGISIQFIHDRDGPELMVRHVVWANENIFDLLIAKNRYSTGNIMIYAKGNSDRLGIGSVSSQTPSTSSASGTDRVDGSVLELPLDKPGNMSAIRILPINQTAKGPNIGLGDTGITLYHVYRPLGASFHDFQIFNASLQIMIGMAEFEDQESAAWPLAETYNQQDDLTLSIRPANFVKQSELSLFYASQVLAYFPTTMTLYRELSTVIMLWGRPIGVICLDKGDRRDWVIEDLCEMPVMPPDLAGGAADGNQTAIS